MRSPVLLETGRYGAMVFKEFSTINRANPLIDAADKELAKYLPDEREREILFFWCAQLVDYTTGTIDDFLASIRARGGYTDKEMEQFSTVIRDTLHYSLHANAVTSGFNEELACAVFQFLVKVVSGESHPKIDILPEQYQKAQKKLERWERGIAEIERSLALGLNVCMTERDS